MARVFFYSRQGCCLCEDAKRALVAAVPEAQMQEIDVDSDPELRSRYGNDVPVAVANGRVLFRHRFDPNCVRILLED